uniref:Uncharacterized protein n=1 Tax=Fagus sylvatica TaxID=28930 RepID=A0A2N9EFU5_FAGSY
MLVVVAVGHVVVAVVAVAWVAVELERRPDMVGFVVGGGLLWAADCCGWWSLWWVAGWVGRSWFPFPVVLGFVLFYVAPNT